MYCTAHIFYVQIVLYSCTVYTQMKKAILYFPFVHYLSLQQIQIFSIPPTWKYLVTKKNH